MVKMLSTHHGKPQHKSPAEWHILSLTMTIHLCDKCGDALGDYKERFQLNVGIAYGIELCKACATPFVDLLVKQDFLGDELVETGFVEYREVAKT